MARRHSRGTSSESILQLRLSRWIQVRTLTTDLIVSHKTAGRNARWPHRQDVCPTSRFEQRQFALPLGVCLVEFPREFGEFTREIRRGAAGEMHDWVLQKLREIALTGFHFGDVLLKFGHAFFAVEFCLCSGFAFVGGGALAFRKMLRLFLEKCEQGLGIPRSMRNTQDLHAAFGNSVVCDVVADGK